MTLLRILMFRPSMKETSTINLVLFAFCFVFLNIAVNQAGVSVDEDTPDENDVHYEFVISDEDTDLGESRDIPDPTENSTVNVNFTATDGWYISDGPNWSMDEDDDGSTFNPIWSGTTFEYKSDDPVTAYKGKWEGTIKPDSDSDTETSEDGPEPVDFKGSVGGNAAQELAIIVVDPDHDPDYYIEETVELEARVKHEDDISGSAISVDWKVNTNTEATGTSSFTLDKDNADNYNVKAIFEWDPDSDGDVEDTLSASKEITLVEAQLKSIEFTSDHENDAGKNILKDNTDNWTSDGDSYEQPEWIADGSDDDDTAERNNPISHTMNKKIKVKCKIKVEPADITFDLEGEGGESYMNFTKEGKESEGEYQEITIEAEGKLPEKIDSIEETVNWKITLGEQEYDMSSSGSHEIFLTMGNPQDTDEARHVPTYKRMNRAVEEAGAADSTDPHKIVETVIENQGEFDPGEGVDNEWRVPDQPADCISIVEFAENVAKMIHVPGTFEAVVIYCKSDAPTEAIEKNAPHYGLQPPPLDAEHPERYDPEFHDENPSWTLALSDDDEVPNNFEACAKFTHEDATTYYPGGVDAEFQDPDNVLGVFKGLAWYSDEIEEVIGTYFFGEDDNVQFNEEGSF